MRIEPYLFFNGRAEEAIEFYKKAFGAVEMHRMPGPGGKLMHAAIRIGDSTIMLADEYQEWGSKSPKTLDGTPVTIHLYVENADAVYDQAIAAGATGTMAMADMFWGDRYGQVIDPFGHSWSIATHIKDMTPEEMAKAAQAGCP